MTTFQSLPPALTPYARQARCVLWRWEMRKAKRTKPPLRPLDPSRHASSRDPQTWTDFDTALAVHQAGAGEGVGLCLLNSDLAALDLDDCRNAASGAIEPAVQQIIDRAQSYCEVTVSGTGLRLLFTSTTSAKVHRKQAIPGANGATAETYRNCERFIVVTGNGLPARPRSLPTVTR
jgi:primase-polymerase (primpol)-like protein